MKTEVVEKLKERYPDLHPLIFLRSVEHAKDVGELFEILESFPRKYPVAWEEESRCWKECDPIRLNELKKITQEK
jgi:hypothetical protein